MLRKILLKNAKPLASTACFDEIWLGDFSTRVLVEQTRAMRSIRPPTDYPYGSAMRQYTSSVSTENVSKFKYQGKERDLESGYDDFGGRLFDSQIGRSLQVDVASDKYLWVSPYNSMGNNPIFLIDPTGDTIVVSKTGYITRNDKTDNLVFMTNNNGVLVQIGEVGKEIDVNEIYKNLLAEHEKEAEGLNPVEFYNLVDSNKEWDLKKNVNTIFGLANQTKGDQTKFIFEGTKMEAQDIGNHHYGVVGLACGFSENILLRAAGLVQIKTGTSKPEWQKVQIDFIKTGTGLSVPVVRLKAPYGDDPRDQGYIQSGFKYYSRMKK